MTSAHATFTADEIDMLSSPHTQPAKPDVTAQEPPAPKRYSDAIENVAARLLTEAEGNLDTAKQAAMDWQNTEHAKVKLTKLQGAASGVDSSTHNKAEWARLNDERTKIVAAMRRQARTGHVKSKIHNAKEAS